MPFNLRPASPITRVFSLQLLVAVGLLAGTAEAAAPDPVPTERLEAIKPAVARVATASGTGSGFLVRGDGLFVTAYHVIAGAPSVWAHFPTGEACEAEGVVAFRPDLDIVVLKLKTSSLPKKEVLVPVGRLPEPESSIAALGYPGGKALTLLRGILMRPSGGQSESRLPITAAVSSGCSGGPIVNHSGQAVGVIISTLGEDLGFGADLAPLFPLPSPTAPVTSLAETSAQFEGTAAQLHSQGSSVLQFWADRSEEGSAARGGIEWARSRFIEAAAKQPGSARPLINAAYCSGLLGEFTMAILYCRKALKADPDSVEARYLLTSAYSSHGDIPRAKQEARAVIAAWPAFVSCRRVLASLHSSAGEHSYAVKELRAALAVRPDDLQSLTQLGTVLIATRDYKQAAVELRKAVTLHPKDAEAHCSLGQVLSMLKRDREAAQVLKTALKLAPEDAAARYVLGVVSVRLGDHAEARRTYERLRQSDPDRAQRLKPLLRK